MVDVFLINRDDFYSQIGSVLKDSASRSNFPKINAWVDKDKTKLYIQASLAGYKPEDVDITVDASDGSLTFESKKVADENLDEKCWEFTELKKSSFYRKFLIHSSVNLNSYDSKYEDGIVTIIFNLKTDEELGKSKIKLR